MVGILYLEDGSIFSGKTFGRKGTIIGEIDFDNSTLKDKGVLKKGSSILINNNLKERSNTIDEFHSKGMIFNDISSNFKEPSVKNSIESMLKEMNVLGLYDINMKGIIKRVVDKGSMKCVLTTESLTVKEFESLVSLSS